MTDETLEMISTGRPDRNFGMSMRRSGGMAKLVMLVGAMMLVSGCVPDVTVQDEGPDWRERKRAWEKCTGNYEREIPDEVRIACTGAIYGGTP